MALLKLGKFLHAVFSSVRDPNGKEELLEPRFCFYFMENSVEIESGNIFSELGSIKHL